MKRFVINLEVYLVTECIQIDSSLTLYVEDIFGDYQCVFLRNRSHIDQIFFIGYILGNER
jgi:hypothetical protein